MYSEEKDFILESVKAAYEKFGKTEGFAVTRKSRYDLVTDVDKNIESYLKNAIYTRFPSDNIISEETLSDKQISGRTWTIDPIDGTVNMARGILTYGVQCALVDGGEIVLSVIYLPYAKEEYYAIKGEGAYLNGKRIYALKDTVMENAIVTMGDYTHKSDFYAQKQHKSVDYLYPKVAKIRMYGAGCIDFALLAGGKTDAAVIITKNLWDLLPGILLCEEAGAKVTDTEGKEYKAGTFGIILSANKELHDMIIKSFS